MKFKIEVNKFETEDHILYNVAINDHVIAGVTWDTEGKRTVLMEGTGNYVDLLDATILNTK